MQNSTIPIVKSTEKSNYPFVVQVRNTENWNTSDATVSLEAAQEVAQALRLRFPSLPVRIQHCTGGMVVTQMLPKFAPSVKNADGSPQKPHHVAIWSGAGEPPAVQSKVVVRVNNIGPGTVTGYAVLGGYLGLLVQADEATRPDWHKNQNPGNEPALVFGAELA